MNLMKLRDAVVEDLESSRPLVAATLSMAKILPGIVATNGRKTLTITGDAYIVEMLGSPRVWTALHDAIAARIGEDFTLNFEPKR